MRTVIIGNSGSGKTWLARRLAKKQAIEVTHPDEIFWLPGGFNIKREESEVSLLIESVRHAENWIVEGVFGNLASRFL
jgi:adenylate kinase family enzyme